MEEDVSTFFDHLNGIRPTIQFIMEMINAYCFWIPILTWKSNGNLDLSVDRKPTHTDRYL